MSTDAELMEDKRPVRWLPLLSTMAMLHLSPDTIPAQVPYLAAEPERVRALAERIGGHGFKIGIVWQGTTRASAAALADFAPLAALEGVRLISLQKGEAAQEVMRVPFGARIERPLPADDLSPEALSSKSTERQLMKLQLLASLRGVTNITGVAISVGDSPLAIPSPSGTTPPSEPQVDPRPLVLRKDSFGFFENDKITPIPSLSQKILALAPSAVTLGSDGTTAVVLSATGVSRVTSNSAAVSLDSRAGLIAPSLDEDGYVWSVPASSPATV